jgi:hypothetical protein
VWLLLAPGEADVLELEDSQQHGAVGWECTRKTGNEPAVEPLQTQNKEEKTVSMIAWSCVGAHGVMPLIIEGG